MEIRNPGTVDLLEVSSLKFAGPASVRDGILTFGPIGRAQRGVVDAKMDGARVKLNLAPIKDYHRTEQPFLCATILTA